MELTQIQKELIKKHIDNYKNWPEREESIKEHKEHHEFFRQQLNEYNILNLTEEEFRRIYKKLFASRIWTNKDWYINNKLLKQNGLEKIKEELKKLLYGGDDIVIRFDNFMDHIKGFGISSISEILNFVFPEKYCLWNNKPITVLPYLKLDNLLPNKFFKYNIKTGSEYKQCIDALDIIRIELIENGFENPNFMDLDCFFWYIFNIMDLPQVTQVIQEPKEFEKLEVETEPQIKSHEGAVYHLLELGKLLNYLTYTAHPFEVYNGKKLGESAILKDLPDSIGERDKKFAKEIDVIWFNESENPSFCLEVENTTNITSGLNRVFQLNQFNVKFAIVAPEEKRSKFIIETSKTPYRIMKDKFYFISYEELETLFYYILVSNELKNKLFGE